MSFTVKTPTGETVYIDLNPTETFIDLNEKVERNADMILDLNDIAVGGENIIVTQRTNEHLEFYSENIPSNIICVVPGCNNTKKTNPDKVFFEFPPEEIRCHQWVLYCQSFIPEHHRRRLFMNPDSSVCGDHFRQDQFVKNTDTLLKRTAVPCIKNFKSETRELQDTYSEGHDVPNYNYQVNINQYQSLDYNPVKFCRLCASTSEDLYYIFDDHGNKMKIADKINLCLPMKIETTDALPKQICKLCLNELDNLFELADQCSLSQHKFINLQTKNFSDTPSKSEENDGIELLCPLCFDGNLNISIEIEVNDRTTERSMSNDLSFLDKLCEDAQIKLEDSSFSLCDISSQKLEVTTFCEPVPISGDPIQIEEKCDNAYSVPTEQLFSEIVTPVNSKDHMKENENLIQDSDQLEPPTPLATDDISSNKSTTEETNLEIVFICRICAEEFIDSIDVLYHSFDHSYKSFYQCSVCVINYETKNDLAEHLNFHSLKNDIIKYCKICHDYFDPILPIQNHVCFKKDRGSFDLDSELYNDLQFSGEPGCNTSPIKIVDENKFNHSFSDKTHSCEECGKLFKSEASKKYHQRSHNNNGDKPYFCTQCSKCFVRKTMLANHMAYAHTNNRSTEISCFACKFCKETFPNADGAFAHLKTLHNAEISPDSTYSFEVKTVKRVFVCEYCDRCFVEGSVLNNHREQHSSDSPYECKFCGQLFISYEELSLHKNSHINDHKSEEYLVDFGSFKTYLCEYCERCFINKVKYSQHLSIHFGPQPYKCRMCINLNFFSLKDAMEHREMHDEISPKINESNYYRPYECHYCNKSFSIEDALIKHIRMHTGEKPFICEQCGKGFSQSSGLYTHLKVHSNERPYPCSLCPRTFKIKGDRDVHVRKHSGDRPYKCEFCTKAFMTQHVYSQHKKIHTGERPYKCDVCGQSFRRSHVLTVHKRIHTGEKPNVCHICGKKYRQKGDMLKHCRTQHGYVTAKKEDSYLEN